MTYDLLIGIKGLKENINKIQSKYEEAYSDIYERKMKDDVLTKKLDLIDDWNKSIINFNVGGKKFSISKSTIHSFKYKTLLSNYQEFLIDKENNYFVDFNKKYFKKFIEIMRFETMSSLGYLGKERKNYEKIIFITMKEDKDNFLKLFESFFIENTEIILSQYVKFPENPTFNININFPIIEALNAIDYAYGNEPDEEINYE